MNRAPAALALALVLSGPRTVRAEPCAPRAMLSGDREAIERVGPELVRLGVSLAPGSAHCPAIQATVELAREGGIAVAVRGSAQRSEGRVVSDPAVAATWIDAWIRDDLDVAGWAPEAAPPAAMAPPSLVAPRDEAPRTGAPETSVLDRIGFSAQFEEAWTDDGTSWRGGNVAACVRAGAFCLGGRVRALVQPDQTAKLTSAARSDVSAYATASYPIALGQTVLAPELGLGVGRFSTRRIDGCPPPQMPPPNCDPTDPMCVMPDPAGCTPDASGAGGKIYVGDRFSTATYTPRIALALRITVPLFHRVWLDGLATYALMPLGHGDPYQPAMAPPMASPGDVALPGEPATGWLLGAGLRVGAP